MITEKKAANAVGGKTARACDSCMCKRARWYCTADDAFLCQACDASVHSANSLARRHERVRLKTSSLKPTTVDDDKQTAEKDSPAVPAWHQGFRRKARTPRGNKPMLSQQLPKSDGQEEPMLMMNNSSSISLPLVPEIGNDETSPDDESEEQLLYRVPIFDPFVAEFCTSVMSNDVSSVITSPTSMKESNGIMSKTNKLLAADQEFGHVVETVEFDENYSGVLLPSDMDLTEFAADVETLLGTGLDEDSFCMQGLGLLDSKEEDSTMECYFGNGSKSNIKLEEDEEGEEEEDQEFDAQHVHRHHHHHHQTEIDISKDYTLDLNFDYDSPTTGEEEEEKAVSGAVGRPMLMMMNNNRYSTISKIEETTKSVSLKLNYDAVVSAWASQGSPWTTGDRPGVLKPDDSWPDYLGTCHPDRIHHQHHHYGGGGGGGDVSGSGGVLADDGGREARVSRYREKRRTRLFSKKIRYEVRKLNAEKRPRMKGRFVKRTSSSSSCFMTGHSVAAAAAALPF